MFDSVSNSMANVLRTWRESHGFSIYEVAKYENVRFENIKNIENGNGTMANLLRYLDFIGWKDKEYLNSILTDWRKEQGFDI